MGSLAESVAIEAMAEKIGRLEREVERLSAIAKQAHESSLLDQIRRLRGRGIILLNLRADARDTILKEIRKDFGDRMAEALEDDMFTLGNAPCSDEMRAEMDMVFHLGMSRF